MARSKHVSTTRFLTLIGMSVATLTMASGCIFIPSEDDGAFCDDFDNDCGFIEPVDSSESSAAGGGDDDSSTTTTTTTATSGAGGAGEGGAGGAGGDDSSSSSGDSTSSGQGGAGGKSCDEPAPVCAPGLACQGLSACSEQCYGPDCCWLSCNCKAGELICSMVCS